MKKTVHCERIMAQLSITPQKWEQWKKDNLSIQTPASEKENAVQSPKSGSG